MIGLADVQSLDIFLYTDAPGGHGVDECGDKGMAFLYSSIVSWGL